MSFIDRIEGPGETQDLPEIKKISLSRALKLYDYLDRKEPKVAELLNKIEELQDIEDSILVVDEAEKLLDDKRTEAPEKVQQELIRIKASDLKKPPTERQKDDMRALFKASEICPMFIPEGPLTDEKRARMERQYFERTGERLFIGNSYGTDLWNRLPDELKPRLVGRKLRHSRANLEKTLARRKGRYSKE